MCNFSLKENLNKEATFLRKVKSKADMNKRGDIAVVILVLGVLALMIFALLSFYLVGEKGKRGGINSAFYLQEIYNNAESVKFSDESLAYRYGVGEEEGKFVLSEVIMEEEGFWGKAKGVVGIGSEDVELLRIKYVFDK